MITALATVVAAEENKQGTKIELSCEQQTSCKSCSSQKSCGTGIISKAVGNKRHNWSLQTEKKVSVGAIVEIGLQEKSLMQFAAIVYILPLVMLILGALIGQLIIDPMIGAGEGITILSSALFLALGILLTRKLSNRLQYKSEQSVILLRVMGNPLEVVSN